MYNFIYAIGASEGIFLTPKEIKKITKHIYNSGKPLSEELVREKIKQL